MTVVRTYRTPKVLDQFEMFELTWWWSSVENNEESRTDLRLGTRSTMAYRHVP
jgi:hypothetical protein